MGGVITKMGAEEASLSSGAARVKFKTKRLGGFDTGVAPDDKEWTTLAKVLARSEACGTAPVLPDGKVGGNGALVSSVPGSIIVSKSGKIQGQPFTQSDFVRVTSFDFSSWTAEFYSDDESILPSSDSPLLWASLMVLPYIFGWEKVPKMILHGHTFATEEAAKRIGAPCAPEETLFSTPEDLQSLVKLAAKFPYPHDKIYVRKHHGFFMMAQDEREVEELFNNMNES